MKHFIILGVLGVALAAIGLSGQAQADPQTHLGRRARRLAARTSWHAPYYHTMYGRPIALVVPPTANMQSHYGWGVTNTRISPIYPQFQRAYPGDFQGGFPGYVQGEACPFKPTPRWPADTGQFGVYYIRGPW